MVNAQRVIKPIVSSLWFSSCCTRTKGMFVLPAVCLKPWLGR